MDGAEHVDHRAASPTADTARTDSPTQQPKAVLTIRVPEPPPRALSRLQRLPTQAARSTRASSFASVATTVRRPIKYGQVRRGGSRQNQQQQQPQMVAVELVPQPSDDDDDPLNWPTWKKELGYWTLLLAAATAGVSKTALVSVGSQLAVAYSVSYTAVAALTGVPLMVSALSGLAAASTTRVCGRRPAYLASAVLLLVGVAWNAAAVAPGADSPAQCMAARVLQGLSWGAFDTLVLGSIHDTYFEHQVPVRLAVYDIVVVGATWGGPLLGGVASSHGGGVVVQFDVLSVFASIVLLLVALAVPETLFDRSFYLINRPASAASSAWSEKALPPRPRMTLSAETAADYLRTMQPWAYRQRSRARGMSRSVSGQLLQPVRAMVAPTTVLLVALSLLPVGALWGLALSLSLLFAPEPLVLTPESRGALMVAPWLLASVVVALVSATHVWPQPWQQWRRRMVAEGLRTVQNMAVMRRMLERLSGGSNDHSSSPGTAGFPGTSCRSPATVLMLVGGGSLLAVAGLLAFGLYVSSGMSSGRSADDDVDYARLSFGAVSFVLGLLAAGTYVVDAAVRPMVRRSTQFTSCSLAVAQRNTADMCAGVGLWRTLAAGAFVIGMPSAVWAWDLLRATSIGVSAAQLLVVAAVFAVWSLAGEAVWRLDGRVMLCLAPADDPA
ncbi:major facilitator superfamily transporter [Grosmannia clavigera kw1407]|uniref:Major facilitator superfamily transporter n=1 Tax=Grosmannia clavigera (strain kw1407 / UAMH 11150) TaxID=655863 RepID=F0XAP8_GROCL|nr:major facilitator superfamily transporter [Grosmannia clavigera kw1407]EFX06117.1 major facilitator superfamily transporter [Grosmannia clavigera kw1407]